MQRTNSASRSGTLGYLSSVFFPGTQSPPVRRFNPNGDKQQSSVWSCYAVSPLARARAVCKRAGVPYALAATPLLIAVVVMLAVVVLSSLFFGEKVGNVGNSVGSVVGGGERAMAQAGRERKVKEASPLLVLNEERDVRPGVALVAACRNRQKQLRETLPTWLALRHVNDIVIVDWASDPPLRDVVQTVTANPRVTVVRVDDEEDWVLSRAYNLAVGVSAREKILRTDCDYAIAPGFVRAHDLGNRARGAKMPKIAPASRSAGFVANKVKGVFYAGNYRLARDENEVHLNGAMYFNRKDFVDVGGYDERIQTYGWDDTDLYRRLEKSGVQQRNISYDHVRHVRHGNAARVQKTVQFAQVEIDLNQLLLTHLRAWSPAVAAGEDPDQSRTTWMMNEAGGPSNYISVVAGTTPKALRKLVSKTVLEKETEVALSRRLSDSHLVPWDLINSMDTATKRKLLAGLDAEAVKVADERGPAYVEAHPPRILFLHAMHGLGNRLRTLASGMSFAKSTGRVLVLVWETDAHIAAEFSDLFKTDIPIITKLKPKWPFTGNVVWDKKWANVHAINYVEMDGGGAVKDAFIENHADKHMYFKSSSIMITRPEYGNWDRDNAELRTLEPVDAVARVVNDHVVKRGLMSRVGMHIRDRTLARDIKNVNFTSEYGSSASDTMEYWRRKSSHRTFIVEMRRLLVVDPTIKFYIATDTREVLAKLNREFPGRILSTPRDCDDRNAHCVQFALIDVLSLARTRRLYGSNWSSFTELAQRLGGPKALLAGRDFDIDGKDNSR